MFRCSGIDLVPRGHDHVCARGFADEDATGTPGVTTGPVCTVAVPGPKYHDLASEDDDVWTRNGATRVVRAGHTSTFQGIRVTRDRLRHEAVVAAGWDDRSATGKEVGEVLDSFTVTEYDDGTKYVTEEGTPVPPAPASGR
ncbi:hypothetical protein ABZ892_23605 [Streptomyces sp. NPDC046924]|uniref:hypothetical protein n=1 Tax=Streptomyces sp. NPDC046924 TaxID=3155136 RepID=UPI003409F04B